MSTRLTIEQSVPATIRADWTINVLHVTDNGNVEVELPANLPMNRPITIHAIFVPKTQSIAGFSAASLLANFPHASGAVPADGTVDTIIEIPVLGVAPGDYNVVIIGEFAI